MIKINFWKTVPLTVIALFVLLYPLNQARAYDMNMIMPDSEFTNYNSMSAGQINDFLGSKGSIYYNYTIPQFVSVPYQYQGGNWATVSVEQTNGSENFYGRSVAQLIYDECQAHQINPRVILAIMQKESSTIEQGYGQVSDTRFAWPLFYGYNETMAGFGYDQATAEARAINFGGMGQQIAYATWNFRSGYYGYNNWQSGARGDYRSAMNIDGTTVYPGSIATRLFYTYTPHSWNNFLTIYARYGWGIYNSAAVDQGPPTGPGAPGTNILPGQQFTLTAYFRNTGSTSWVNSGANVVDMGLSSPRDRGSAFLGGAGGRGQMEQAEVAPGGIGTFDITMTAPSQGGTYIEHFQLLAEGITWFGSEISWTLTVAPPAPTFYNSRVIQQGPYYGPGSYGVPVQPGQQFTIWAVFQNTSNITWDKYGSHPIHMGMSSPPDRPSAFAGGNSLRGLLDQLHVYEGSYGAFAVTLTAPEQPGTYVEHFRLVAENIAWFGQDISWTFVVPSTNALNAQIYQQGPYYGPGTPGTPIGGGQSFTIWIKMLNSGGRTWYRDGANPTHIGTFAPMDRLSPFWNAGRRGVLAEDSVAPGEVGTFVLYLTAPSSAGTYVEHFRLVTEGVTWFGPDISWTLQVS